MGLWTRLAGRGVVTLVVNGSETPVEVEVEGVVLAVVVFDEVG
jgi:hypothetical protein